MPGTHQMIGTGLTCGIRRAGRIGRRLGEKLLRRLQIPIHLVGGDVMEAERCLLLFRQRSPILPSSLQQGIGADDIGLYEGGRTIDGAIDMRLCSQVHHYVRLIAIEDAVKLSAITNIYLFKTIPITCRNLCKRLQVTGIGKLIQVNYMILSSSNDMPNNSGTNKTSTTGNKKYHDLLRS
ncbi:hypothetical protein D9M69_473990 [compost metagenome]